jgi:hypothetical protein
MQDFGEVKKAAEKLAINRCTVWRYCRAHPSIANNGKIDLNKLAEAIKNAHRRTARGFPLGERWLRKHRYLRPSAEHPHRGRWLKEGRKRKKTERARKLHAAIRGLHERRRLQRERLAGQRRRVDGGLSWGSPSVEGLHLQFRVLRQQIGNLWQEWTPDEVGYFRELISEIVEFDRELEHLQKTKTQKQQPSPGRSRRAPV